MRQKELFVLFLHLKFFVVYKWNPVGEVWIIGWQQNITNTPESEIKGFSFSNITEHHQYT